MIELIVLVVLGTTVWVGFDAHQRGHDWLGWAVGCLLLWVVVFPWYLAHRARTQETSATVASRPRPRRRRRGIPWRRNSTGWPGYATRGS
jgi:hypothetical protein